MRIPTSTPCLRSGQHPMLRSILTSRTMPTFTTPIRWSSLSAIHRGLRDSEKARPQGFHLKALEAASTGGKGRKPPTSRQRRDPNWTPPTFKMTKGKKNITDKGPQPKSRRMRFNDPSEAFGKRSLVWQMKHGNLRGEMEKMQESDMASRPSSTFSDRSRDSKDSRPRRDDRYSKPFQRSGERDDRRSRGTGFSNEGGRFERKFDRSFGSRDSRNAGDRSFARSTDRDGFSSDRPDRPPRSSFNATGQSGGRFSRDRENNSESHRNGEGSFKRDSPREDGPVRVHHTTAASQFLYGRSVVEAALKHSRRQLYRLYVYSGEDRQNLVQDRSLIREATSRKVEVQQISNPQGLRMLDKMSGGRPHNGCVLEASPLPQLPVKGLGVVSEETGKKGFQLELNHQSAEEAQVNGSSTFVPFDLPEGRHPLVLLLDGILDPGNLGAILRSAAFLGVNAVAITKDSSAGLTPVALKASAGASEVMTMFSVKSTAGFLEQSKEAGWMVYAAVPSTSRIRNNSHLSIDRVEAHDPLSTQPTILVIGSEGEGLAKQVRRISDHEVSIPSASRLFDAVDSLNASVATALLCQSFLKQQTTEVLRNQGFTEKSEDSEAMF